MGKYIETISLQLLQNTFDLEGFKEAVQMGKYAEQIKSFNVSDYQAPETNFMFYQIDIEVETEEPKQQNEIAGYLNNLADQYDALFVSSEELASML